MDLTVREVACLLGTAPETVYRWIRAGELPAHRVGDHYRLNRVELQEWAHARGVKLPPALHDPTPQTLPLLTQAVERGGVFADLRGATREEVLDDLAKRAGPALGLEPARLTGALLRREAMASTGMGDGIAIPHPRNPVVLHVSEPRVLLGYLAQPVDFDAVDGVPVRVLFVLLSPTVRIHLQLLARVAFVLHDAGLRAMLLAHAPAVEALARIRELEAGGAAAEGTRPGSPPKANRA
ncbi:MAG: PTS sugar transporter subunit IIA [Candidatus Eisenbacteria bacterium]|nr:PTS sugar transporter subunit IIA [Candidatus Eisenbacteria bacterium]